MCQTFCYLKLFLLHLYIIIQILHILTKNLQLPGIISRGPSANPPAKIFQSIRNRNNSFKYYSLFQTLLIARVGANLCILMKHT